MKIYCFIITVILIISLIVNYLFFKNPFIKKEYYTNSVTMLSNVYSEKPIYKYVDIWKLSNIISISNVEVYNIITQMVFIENEYSNYANSDIYGKVSNYYRNGDIVNENIWMWHYKNTNKAIVNLYLPNYKYIIGIGARENILSISNRMEIISSIGINGNYRPINNIDFLIGGDIYSSIDLKLISGGINLSWGF